MNPAPAIPPAHCASMYKQAGSTKRSFEHSISKRLRCIKIRLLKVALVSFITFYCISR